MKIIPYIFIVIAFLMFLLMVTIMYGTATGHLETHDTQCASIGMGYQRSQDAPGFGLCYAPNESGQLIYKPVPKLIFKTSHTFD